MSIRPAAPRNRARSRAAKQRSPGRIGPVRLAQVGGLDALVGQHGFRASFGDLAPEIQHHHMMGDVHDHTHVVLDHHHGHSPLLIEIDDIAGHVFFFFEVHAGHRLIQEEKTGSQRDCSRQLHPLAQSVGQGGRDGVPHMLYLEQIDDVLDRAAVLQLLGPGAGQPVQRPAQEIVANEMMPPNENVLEDRHVSEQGEILEGAADTEPGAVARRPIGDVQAGKSDAAHGGPVAA
jgi:hypothetical protein